MPYTISVLPFVHIARGCGKHHQHAKSEKDCFYVVGIQHFLKLFKKTDSHVMLPGIIVQLF
jgi:hypothetical protein